MEISHRFKNVGLFKWFLVTCLTEYVMGSPSGRFIVENSNAIYDNHNVHDGHQVYITTHVNNVVNSDGCNFRGVHYALAQSIRDSDGCSLWSCTSSGMVVSTNRCPEHLPSSTDSLRCSHDGATYEYGDTFLHHDGCNICVCSKSIECRSLGTCAVNTTTTSPCTHDGHAYPLGEVIQTQPACTRCTCTVRGFQCTWEQCTSKPTSIVFTATHKQPTVSSTSSRCYQNGVMVVGRRFRTADGCSVCTCYKDDGEVCIPDISNCRATLSDATSHGVASNLNSQPSDSAQT